MLEAEIVKGVVAHAKKNKVLHKRLHFAPGAETGWPDDLFIFYEGPTLWVEFKATGKKPKAIQEKRIDTLEAYGQHVHVIDSIEAGIELLDAFIEEHPHP